MESSSSARPSTFRPEHVSKKALPTNCLFGMLVHQDSAVIEHHYRTDLDWMTEVVGAGETIQLRCPSITLAIDDLYS